MNRATGGGGYRPNAAFAVFTRPDWVMCGCTMPSGWVRLLASKELNRADLEAQFDRAEIFVRDDDLLPSWGPVIRRRIMLTAEMRSVVLIDAPDYPAAFADLFAHWSPAPDQRPALGEGQREISG